MSNLPDIKINLMSIPFLNLGDLSTSFENQIIRTKGRLHVFRKQGSIFFLVLRHQLSTLQCVIFKAEKQLGLELAKIAPESYLEIAGKLVKTPTPINSTSIKDMEIHLESYTVISHSEPVLPFQLEDAMTPIESESKSEGAIHVGMDLRLNNRSYELRTPTNYAIFKLQTAISQYFRQFLINQDFIEIHSPKLIAGASEGGSEVFKLQYFDQSACLAQSPQLYKQAAICGDFNRVFEIGPVFRAEKSVSHRHLCEFTGLDIEMEIDENYYEVTKMISNLLVFIFDSIYANHQKELNLVATQFGDYMFKYKYAETGELLMINFKEGVELINKYYESKNVATRQSLEDDLNATNERLLGQLVAEKYSVNIFILDKYPTSARPFYTMPETDGEGNETGYTNSYDIIMCGEEITSGSQRIHQVEHLIINAAKKGMNPETLKDYLQSFKYGVPKHGGCGIGLERITMLLLNLQNVRRSSLFPRDPYRLTP
jgi:nondiscriminating aspartyl-tRNA synthetase